MNDPDDIITRCPSCQTSFRITGEQLKVAAGAVRCGACLRIFQADDEIIQVLKLPTATETLPGLQGCAPMPPLQFAMPEKDAGSVELAAEDSLTLGDKRTEGSVDSRRGNSHEPIEEMRHEPFDGSAGDIMIDQFWRDWHEYVENCIVKESQGRDNEWLSTNLSGSNVIHQRPTGKASADPHNAGQGVRQEIKNTADEGDPEDESLAQSALEKSASQRAGQAEKVQANRQPGATGLDDDLEGVDLDVVDLAEWVDHLHLGNDRAEIIQSELVAVPRARGWSAAASALMVLLLLLTGLAQYAWFNKDIYAQDVRMRPYFLAVCHWVSCMLPDYVNDDDLVTQNLVVRPHKRVEGALVVDAILRNSAIFRQQFPLLELQFEDINGRVVAMRRFSPQEYLAGELRGLRFIPANTEVRFSLDILRPGDEALGFSLKVVHRRW